MKLCMVIEIRKHASSAKRIFCWILSSHSSDQEEVYFWDIMPQEEAAYCIFHAGFCLAYSTTMKTEAIYSCETSVDSQHTTRRYNPEDITLQAIFCIK
jgi:hypothetical protein